MTSLNAHCGPVDFLVAASTMLTSDLLRHDPTDPEDEDNQGAEQSRRGQEATPPQAPSSFLLQYGLRSTSQLPGKLLSSQPDPGSPRLPADPPEHRSIYAVREDPDVWVRGQTPERGSEGETRRSRVTSTAVFSGGRGHRRLGPSSTEDWDKMENTLLVWQLPLSVSQ